MKVIVYTDAAANKSTRVVNRFGKTVTDTHGWRIGVVCGDREERFVNAKAEDSFAAETWGLLKGLEFALECHPNATEVEIRSDCQQAGAETRHDQANTYVRVMTRLAAERSVRIVHVFVSGSENPADRVSRTDAPIVTPEPATPPGAMSRDGDAAALQAAILPTEIAAYNAILAVGYDTVKRKKKVNELVRRVGARLGIETCGGNLGHHIKQAAVRAVDNATST